MPDITKTSMAALSALGWIAAAAPVHAQLPQATGSVLDAPGRGTIGGDIIFYNDRRGGDPFGPSASGPWVPPTTDAAVSVTPTATPTAVPARAALPSEAATLMRQAVRHLEARETVQARGSLERAETLVLNARGDGETGFDRIVSDLGQAREALARNDTVAATVAIQRALDARG